MGHDHNHLHSHDTGAGNLRAAFIINLLFAGIELVGGLYTNSVAILSDALHDFGDSLSLGAAWYLQKKAKQPEDATYKYGYRRFSILGAIINSIVLTIGSIFVIKEAVARLSEPQQTDAKGMLILAILGIFFNTIAMLRLKKGSSLNERVVSLHFLEDILGWIAVLIGALVMVFYNVPILDPILSLGIACFILFNVYRNVKPALRIILQGMPDTRLEEEIKAVVLQNVRVIGVHDFRLWSLDGEHSVITMHVTVNEDMSLKDAEHLKEQIKRGLQELHVSHATIEIEYNPDH